MTTLVLGASGATGRLLVDQLLKHGQTVKAIVRSRENLPKGWATHDQLEIIIASPLDLTDLEMAEHVKDCQAIASCLGHNLTWKGVYGKPRRLVTEAASRFVQAAKVHQPKKPVKYVLMNTTGNRNRDLKESISFAQKCVIALLRLLLPPHVDNEKAADYLRIQIGQNDPFIEWTCVRPDNLIDEEAPSDYKVYPSPIKSAIFDAGKTSRINVGHFMAELISNEKLWSQWKGQMPVIYNTLLKD
jgi:nucleoside-diphosphate-sugar epimerase